MVKETIKSMSNELRKIIESHEDLTRLAFESSDISNRRRILKTNIMNLKIASRSIKRIERLNIQPSSSMNS
jgi:hypothetical protein